MKAMRKRFLAAGLGLAAMSVIASDASATRFTEEAEFWLGTVIPNNPPPISAIEIQGTADQGGLFTNTYAPTGLNPADPVVIHTVGINKISGFSNGNGFVVTDPGGALGQNAYVIFALTGTATPTGPSSASALFTGGQAIVVELDPNIAFDAKRPTTWQFDNTSANVLAVYDLAAQEEVRQGLNGDNIGAFPGNVVPAGSTNFSAINTQTDVLSQGVFLFDFDSNGAAHDGLPQDFQENQAPLTGLPGTEGLVIFTSQTNPNTAAGFDASDEAVLNDIFNTLLTQAFSDNTNPLSNFDLGVLGDFYNEFAFSANPTSQAAVPEPATMALGLMGLAGLLVRRRRMA